MTDIVARLAVVVAKLDEAGDLHLTQEDTGWLNGAMVEIEFLRKTLGSIDKFITAVAPTKLTKELDSIRTVVRAADRSIAIRNG